MYYIMSKINLNYLKTVLLWVADFETHWIDTLLSSGAVGADGAAAHAKAVEATVSGRALLGGGTKPRNPHATLRRGSKNDQHSLTHISSIDFFQYKKIYSETCWWLFTWMAVGTPAKPFGQEQTSLLFSATQLALGPHELPTVQGSWHLPSTQTSCPAQSAWPVQPGVQIPALQVSPGLHCWAETQVVWHWPDRHFSPSFSFAHL